MIIIVYFFFASFLIFQFVDFFYLKHSHHTNSLAALYETHLMFIFSILFDRIDKINCIHKRNLIFFFFWRKKKSEIDCWTKIHRFINTINQKKKKKQPKINIYVIPIRRMWKQLKRQVDRVGGRMHNLIVCQIIYKHLHALENENLFLISTMYPHRTEKQIQIYEIKINISHQWLYVQTPMM